ncbi:MAG: endonuclease/exonuclease/phosphatase family protein [Akkermansiaceae bacterium]
MRLLNKIIFTSAPRILLGAFFLCASCEQEEKTDKSRTRAPDPVEKTTPVETPQEKGPEIPLEEEPTSPEASGKPVAETAGGIRFMAYNIENYLTMTRYVKGGGKVSSPKDPEEVAALVKIIVGEKPDILGICEIGTEADLMDLQGKLKAAGLDLAHFVHTGGIDSTRRLGILSAFPITGNHSKQKLIYEINGHERMMGRGILDVTIDLPGGSTHFIGLHLKSKRELEDFDQAEIRLNEARLAREHCDAILAAEPNARIVLYGDMNDTRKTPPLAMLMGKYKSDTYMGDVFAKDSRGHLWTHFWSYQQQYARFDWVMISPAVYPDVDSENSYIADPDTWNDASDHRAVVVTLKK